MVSQPYVLAVHLGNVCIVAVRYFSASFCITTKCVLKCALWKKKGKIGNMCHCCIMKQLHVATYFAGNPIGSVFAFWCLSSVVVPKFQWFLSLSTLYTAHTLQDIVANFTT